MGGAVRSAVVLFIVVLFSCMVVFSVPAVRAAHGCVSPIPPSVPGSSSPAPATPHEVLFNEVLLNPQSKWNCSEPGTTFSEWDAWVEFYNPQNQAFNLYAAHAILDSGPATNPFYFPFGASIAAHGYLVVFPRTDGRFTLTETATLRLLIAGVIIDQLTVPGLAGDQSYARIPDGTGKWQITNTPTIDASNNVALPTPTVATSSTSTGNQGYGGQNGGSVNTSGPVVTGTQPAWTDLTLPMPTPTLAPTTPASLSSPVVVSSPSAQVSDDLAVPRRIALTLLSLALGVTLFWCWGVFSKRDEGK